MRGEVSSGKFAKRHPLDWYVDEVWCAGQLMRALGDFRAEKDAGEAIWDPAAGFGNTVDTFLGTGLQIYLSDVVENVDWLSRDPQRWTCPPLNKRDVADHPTPRFFSADFLETEVAPAPCSIVCNPPYSYRKGIAEAFVRHALKLTSRRVCMLLPSKWLASQVRYRLFAVDHPPQAVLHFTTRPSMPPGDRIHLMGSRAFRGGMVDYCWIVWNVLEPTRPGQTRTVWLPPIGETQNPIEGLA
jgi:hypothetical protein